MSLVGDGAVTSISSVAPDAGLELLMILIPGDASSTFESPSASPSDILRHMQCQSSTTVGQSF